MYRNLTIVLVIAVILVLITQILITKNKLAFPVEGKITSPFGTRVHPITGSISFHNGIDIATKTGTPVFAPASGTVLNRFYNTTGGNQLVLKHGNGYTTGYAHLSDTLVNIGQRVTKKQVIAKTGATGAVTGPHLHFTLKNQQGKYINPQILFR